MTFASTVDSWVKCFKPNPRARIRVLCFPYAGGGASIFRSWSELLPPEVEACAVQLPGREDQLRQAPFTQLSLLEQTLAQVLEPYLHIPLVLFGHSMGGLISFELARQLRRQRQPTPVHLFVSGHHAPQLPDPNPPIHQLPDPAFVAELRRLNGTPETVLQNSELMEVFLPVLRADFAICETYKYSIEAPLDCPLSVFGGLRDDRVSRDELAAWRSQTSASFTLDMFPGNHFFLESERAIFVRALAQHLQQHLRRTD